MRAYDLNTTKLVLKAPSIENSTLMRYGDINNDGVIDNKDLALLVAFVNGSQTPTPLQEKLAAVAGDREGKLTTTDIECLTNYINGDRPAYVTGEKSRIGKTGVIYGIGDVTEAIELFSSNSKVELDMNHAQFYSNFDDDIFHIHNPEGLCLESGSADIKLTAYNDIILGRFSPNAPILKLTGNQLKMTDPDTPNLQFTSEFTKSGNDEIFTQIIGKSRWQYNNTTKYLSLLSNDTTRMQVYPSAYLLNNKNKTYGYMYFDSNANVGDDSYTGTYIKRNELLIDNTTSDKIFLKATDRYLILSDAANGSVNTYIKTMSTDNNRYFMANSIGNVEIKNTTGKGNNSNTTAAIGTLLGSSANIKFTGNSATNTSYIYHYYNDDWLRVWRNLRVDNDLRTTGDIYVEGGDLTIKGKPAKITLTDGTNTANITFPNSTTFNGTTVNNVINIDKSINLGNNPIYTTANATFKQLYVGNPRKYK